MDLTDARPRSGRRIVGALFRVLIAGVASCCLLLMGLVALGAAVGRFHAVPVEATGPGVHVSPGALAILRPTSPAELQAGDVVVARYGTARHDTLYRLSAVDSWTNDLYTRDAHGKQFLLKLEHTPARVSSVVPYAGVPFRYLAGALQGILLLAAGALLMASGARRRMRARYESKLSELAQLVGANAMSMDVLRPRRGAARKAWWVSRLAIGVTAMLGILSLTASANFSGTATIVQGAVTAAHMTLDAGTAGAQTNRLTIGANASAGNGVIAPGDRIQRSLDLTVNASTSTGVMTGITLLVTASPSSALNTDSTNGLRIFIQDCQTSVNGTGWTESASGSVWTYSCTKGAGGSWNDLLNSSPTNDPTAVPSAGTCATSSGGTSSYRALSEMSSPSTSTPFALVNLPLTSGALVASTTIHMVITMCFPTNAGDSFQDATSTFSFAFAGVQRAGANR